MKMSDTYLVCHKHGMMKILLAHTLILCVFLSGVFAEAEFGERSRGCERKIKEHRVWPERVSEERDTDRGQTHGTTTYHTDLTEVYYYSEVWSQWDKKNNN